MLDDAEDVLPRRAERGADGRAAQVHHAEPLFALVDSPAVAGKGLGVGRHFVAQRHEHGVLQLGAADLHHVGELLFLLLERLHQADDFPLQFAEAEDRRHAEGRGIGVVGRLVAVDVVVRVDRAVVAQRPAEELQGPIGQHFVDVHVRRGARAALQGVDDDVLVEPAVDHFLAGRLDGGELGRLVFGSPAQFVVRPGGGQLDRAEAVHQAAMHGPAGRAESSRSPAACARPTARRPARRACRGGRFLGGIASFGYVAQLRWGYSPIIARMCAYLNNVMES